jgi:hypothetical protein
MYMQAHPPPTTISRLGISFRFSAPVDDTILHVWQTLVSPFGTSTDHVAWDIQPDQQSSEDMSL